MILSWLSYLDSHIRSLYFSPTAAVTEASKPPLGGGERRLLRPLRERFSRENNPMMIPGLSQLAKDLKAVEDHARACQSREEEQMVLLTREEVEVIESFRRFKAQDYD